MNAIIGDNGIITRAQEATILQSCANIEEFLQEFYVSNYENFPTNVDNKVEAIEQYEDSKDYIWNPSAKGYGSFKYVITPDGYKCYFINKAGLPKDLQDSIKGGDAGGGTIFDYSQMNDVYGVTTDLKVYYCSEGKSTMLGMSEEKLETDDPNREVFSNKTEVADSKKAMYEKLKKYDINEDEILSAQEVRSINTLTITPSDNITSLLELSNLINLNTLVIEGMTLDSLDGINNLPILENLTLTNTVVTSYDELAKCLNLKFLCFLFNDSVFDADSEVKKVCGTNGDGHVGISQANFKSLNRLAFTGSMANDGFTGNVDASKSSLTDLSSLKNLSVTVTKNVKTLYVQNNHLSSIDFLDSFTSLEVLLFQHNNVVSLKGVEYCELLKRIEGGWNYELGDNDGTSVEDVNNALYYVQFCKNLELLNLVPSESEIKFISYVNDLKKLQSLSIDSENLNIDDLNSCKKTLIKLNTCQLNSKYSLLLTDENTTSLSIAYQKMEKDVFECLTSLKNLKNLIMDYFRLVDENGAELSREESNTIINSTLKEFKNLEQLDACGTRLSTIDFIYDDDADQINTPNLLVFHLRDTDVTDLSNLEKLSKLKGFSVNNTSIALNLIPKTISRCGNIMYNHGYQGMYLENESLLKQLENCVDITNIFMDANNWNGTFENLSLDLSSLVNLKTVEIDGFNFNSLILPPNVTNLTLKRTKSFPNLSNLSKLKYLYFSKGEAFDKFQNSNVIDSLSSMVFSSTVSIDVTLIGLTDLVNLELMSGKYNLAKLNLANCRNLNNLSGVNGLKTTNELSITGCPELINLVGLGNLSLLSKLTINGSGITDLSELANLTSLSYIDLKNNLALGNKYGSVDNLQLLADLRNKNNGLKVYLAGNNNILDWSKLSAFGSWWHDSEKAGY